MCGLIRLGLRRGPAARRLRVAPSTIEAWTERGEADLESGVQSEFAEFVVEMEMARVALETDALETIHRAIKGSEDKPGDANAAFKMLERVRPEQWSPTHKVEHTGDINIVQQHAEQLLAPLTAILTELDVVDDPRVPDLIEKYFTPMERATGNI